MAGYLGRRGGGFTLFEFAVVATLCGVLAGVLLSRAAFYHGEAERVAAEYLVASLRRALQLRVIEGQGVRRERALELIAEENPMDWLAKKPDNYLGEYYSPDLEKMPSGNWVFDRRDKILIYLPASRKSFYFIASNLLKFKVKFVHSQQRTRDTKGSEEVSGLALVQIGEAAANNTD